MLTNQEIMKQLSQTLEEQQEAVLATVVSVQGSAYRREGAKMLIETDGKYHGLISGGCLEADVVEEAKKVAQTGQAFLKKYDLDEDLVWGLGLGCPGVVEVLLERVARRNSLTQSWLEQIKRKEAVVYCKVLETESHSSLTVGEAILVSQEEFWSSCSNLDWQEELVRYARLKLTEPYPQSESKVCTLSSTEEQARIFFDVMLPPHQVLIFGAGHDALPLAKLSSQLGFSTIVIDPRPAYNTAERFPTAERAVQSAEQFAKEFSIHKRTFIVIMNHHLERDKEVIDIVMRSSAYYVGVLGPRKRREKMLAQLSSEGKGFTEEQLAKMYSPIGLDIGADTPEEIAVSIMAEIVALRNGHQGGFLNDSQFIHKPSLSHS